MKAAAVKIDLTLEATGDNKLMLVLDCKGTFWIALAEKRSLGMDLEGEYKTAATNPDNQMVMVASGRMNMSESIVWEKIAGVESTSGKSK